MNERMKEKQSELVIWYASFDACNPIHIRESSHSDFYVDKGLSREDRNLPSVGSGDEETNVQFIDLREEGRLKRNNTKKVFCGRKHFGEEKWDENHSKMWQ